MEQNLCNVRKKCGGCQLQGLSYEEQLQYKQNKVNTLLSSFGNVNDIVPMEHPLHYRNKVQAAFYYDPRRKRCASGVFQSNSGRIVPVDHCMIEDRTADRIIVTIRKLCDSFKIKPFDPYRGSGYLRHVLVRRGFFTNQTMVVLVTATPYFPSAKNFVKALLAEHKEITTVVLNQNTHRMNLMLGERSTVLYGNGYIEDKLCGYTFRISPSSFYQINPVQCEKLYQKAIDFAMLSGKETVFDAYCGTGTIGMIAAKQAKSVIGAELNSDAITDAKYNARRNRVDNIRFECADAEKFIINATRKGIRYDAIIMDPPRAGASRGFLHAAAAMKPKRMVYISCNPVTLQRDLAILTSKGYRVEEIQPFDMFPYTKHIETAVKLSRR